MSDPKQPAMWPGWVAVVPWACTRYVFHGYVPHVRDALELGLVSGLEATAWLETWFQKHPDTPICVEPLNGGGTHDGEPRLFSPDGGSMPLDSFGIVELKPLDAPAEVEVTRTIELVWNPDPDSSSGGVFFATDGESADHGATPGEALAALGRKIDARLIAKGWRSEVEQEGV